MASKRVEHAEVECAAADCSARFVPKRSTARFHTATCQRRAARARKAAEAAEESDAKDLAAKKAGDAEHQLVTVTRRELAAAGVLDTVNGQLALNLARKLVDVDAKGVAALTRELRNVLTEAKAGGQPPAPSEGGIPAGVGDEDDELTEARRRRDAKARQAADRA